MLTFLNSTYAQQSRAKTQAELDAQEQCNLQQVSLQMVMKVYFSHLLCQTINLLKDDDGKSSPTKTADFITALEKEMQNNATLQGYAITFPTDKTAIINDIVNSGGDCTKLEAVAETLVSGFAGTIKTGDYNNTIIPTYPEILEAVIKATTEMKIEFYEIKDEKRLDENTNSSCSLYPTYETANLIKKGARWYYADEGKSHSLKIQVKPSQKVTDLDLKAVEETVSIINLQTAKNPATFTLVAQLKGGQNLTMSKIQGKDKTKEPIVNGLNVITCKKKNIPINIYLLKDKNHTFSVDKMLIEAEVKNLFSSITGTVTIQFIDQQVDYKTIDINGNRQVDKDTPNNFEADSLSLILQNQKVPAFKVAIIDLPIRNPKLTEEQTIGGYASRSFKFALADYASITENVVISAKVPEKSSIASSIAHELGHFIFGLRHPFEEFAGFSQGTDGLNIMDYPQGVFPLWSERIFRAYQVKLIENGSTK